LLAKRLQARGLGRSQPGYRRGRAADIGGHLRVAIFPKVRVVVDQTLPDAHGVADERDSCF
jgi:hypothetical protein